MTWLPSTQATMVEYLVDAAGRATGHEIQRGSMSGIYSGSCRGEPVGRASIEIYSVRRACEDDARARS